MKKYLRSQTKVASRATKRSAPTNSTGQAAALNMRMSKLSDSGHEARTPHLFEAPSRPQRGQMAFDARCDLRCGVDGGDCGVAVNLSTVQKLREWARWGEAQNICYPSMSPMFGERALKTALFGIGYIPPDVLEVELVVCRLEWELRFVLILRYQRHLPWSRIGRVIDRDWRTARTRTQAAEAEVHHKLTGKSSLIVGRRVRFVRLFKTVSA